jgi:hypothetical protein
MGQMMTKIACMFVVQIKQTEVSSQIIYLHFYWEGQFGDIGGSDRQLHHLVRRISTYDERTNKMDRPIV